MTAKSAAPRHARTRRLIRKFTVALTAFATVATGAVALGATSALATTGGGGGPKVFICHRTNSTGTPYEYKEVSVNGVWGPSGHYEHDDGPIWNPSMPNGGDWGDIIPVGPDGAATQPSANMGGAGADIFANDCQVWLTPQKPDVNESECSASGATAPTLELATTAGISYSVSKPGPYVAGETVIVTATATGSLWIGDTHHWDVSADHRSATYEVTFDEAPSCPVLTDPTVTQSVCTTPGEHSNPTISVPAETALVKYTIAPPSGWVAGGSAVVTAWAKNGGHFMATAGWVLSGSRHSATFTVTFSDPGACLETAELTAPTVTEAVCTGPGTHDDPMLSVPADTALVTYSVVPASGWVAGGTATVTATAGTGYKFEATAGWVVSASGKTATHEVTFGDPGACLETAELTAPTVTEAVCTGPGTHDDPMLSVPADTALVSYVVAPASGWVAGGSALVTATAGTGYKFEATAGWDVSANGKTATQTVTFGDPGACLETAELTAPTVTEAVCTGPGTHDDPMLSVPADTALVSYVVAPASGWVAGGSALVTATAGTGYKFEATSGWDVSANGKTATQTVTFGDPGDCLVEASPVAPIVVQAVCTGPGTSSLATVTPVATTGISYVVSPDFTVTATADSSYQLVSPLPEGWTLTDAGAVFTPVLVSPGDCLAPVLPLAPTAPLATCESQSMTVTLPTTVGVIYTPSGSLVLAPTESVTIAATAAQGYKLAGEVTSWQFTNALDLTTCGGVGGLVVAEIPQATTPTCQAPDMTVTLPVTTGVIYTASGPLLLAPGESVTVTPTADTGFILDASAKPTTFTNSFDLASCAGVAGITVTRPVTQPGLGYTGIVGLQDELILVFATILAGTMLTVFARRGRAN